jgi:ankyrin repeat protein
MRPSSLLNGLRLLTIAGFVALASAATIPKAPIADAAMQGDVAAVRRLIAEGANVNAAQGDGMTALHWAAEHGDSVVANVLLRAHANVKAVTRIGNYTPLHIASKSGSGAVVRALLKAGSDPNAATASGATALHFAAASGSVDAVNALLDRKADANARESEWGQTPLVFAASEDRADVIRTLLKRGGDPSIRTTAVNLTEQAAQEQAATRRRNEMFTSFLPKAKRDSVLAAAAAAAKDAAQAQPIAASQGGIGTPDTPRQGRQGGAPPPSTDGLTPSQIQEAIVAGRTVLTAPVTKPASEEADTADGQVAGYASSVGSMGGLTALHHAVRQGNLAAVVALLDGGADVNEASGGDATTPLLLSTINGQFDVSMKLIERGANPNLASTAGATPLYTTINTQWAPRSRFPQPQALQNQRTAYLDVMQALLKAGADPNVRIKQHLWYFAYNNCGNANCGLENLEGTTAFWRAAYAVDVDAMKLLVAHGADPKLPSERTPVATVARGGADGRAGAGGRGAGAGGGGGRGGRGGGRGDGNPLQTAEDSAARFVPIGVGTYPIHAAAGVGYGNGFAGNSHRHAPDGWLPAMKYLVETLGADVNQRDANGYTPLHHAAARGDNEMIQYLVSKGADVKAVARNGRTVVDMANGPVQRVRPFPETIALLEKLGAKNNHRCVSC